MATVTNNSGNASSIGSGGGSSSSSSVPPQLMHITAQQFREIHKNTWLKRLTAEGKKVTIGPKKSDRSWVVFCVHDDTEALLEGYAEPRHAATHNPEWIVSMQNTLHISHALIPNSHEFEFVVTLSDEVVRFHAMSWEIMQEWVETLRSKLREMKILSPRENLYTKLPEVKPPLLPTRDPTSPLPAPPPVPAALVPGVERVVPSSLQQQTQQPRQEQAANNSSELQNASNDNATASSQMSEPSNDDTESSPATTVASTVPSNSAPRTSSATVMSNTLSQNLLNMLSNPITTYNEQLNCDDENQSFSDADSFHEDADEASANSSILRKTPLCSSISRRSENSIRVDVSSGIHSNIIGDATDSENSLCIETADNSSSKDLEDTNHEGNIENITELEIKASSSSAVCSSAKSVNVKSKTSSKDKTLDETVSNITIIQVSTAKKDNEDKKEKGKGDTAVHPPQLPTKPVTIQSEILTSNERKASATATNSSWKHMQQEYKSNVQIIPSSDNSISSSNQNNVIKVLSGTVFFESGNFDVKNSNIGEFKITNSNQYSTPLKKVMHHHQEKEKLNKSTSNAEASTVPAQVENQQITKVHINAQDTGKSKAVTTTPITIANTSTVSIYGSCFTPPSPASSSITAATTGSPRLPKKIILTANTSGVTNIKVDNEIVEAQIREESKTEIVKVISNAASDQANTSRHYDQVFPSSSAILSIEDANAAAANKKRLVVSSEASTEASNSTPRELTSDPPTNDSVLAIANIGEKAFKSPNACSNKSVQTTASLAGGSPPVPPRVQILSPMRTPVNAAQAAPHRMLKRGVTEAVIVARPSRRDFHIPVRKNHSKSPQRNLNKSKSPISNTPRTTNNNSEALSFVPTSSSTSNTPVHSAVNRTASDAIEQRRRSSSTSDARTPQQQQRIITSSAMSHARSMNNNEVLVNSNIHSGLRNQQSMPPFRNAENGGLSPPPRTTKNAIVLQQTKRMTLREQQVMQLRREIMHPGGVRLQLRRKDCVGSIAWVDAFGAVWIAGWKQKEHPVLYNALHIGDQLLSIAGVAITSAAEANKIIRNANTLFVEVLVRRIPFGRAYAIRREREGQCLGLIRDGNTATIVDVVPNSLCARHGLPPKAQSCDGSTLTFWILTEINARPLNLFFKDNEIRDRLNSVGRDISILVQPSDLITKLKKQLKSLRGYKDYLVQ